MGQGLAFGPSLMIAFIAVVAFIGLVVDSSVRTVVSRTGNVSDFSVSVGCGLTRTATVGCCSFSASSPLVLTGSVGAPLASAFPLLSLSFLTFGELPFRGTLTFSFRRAFSFSSPLPDDFDPFPYHLSGGPGGATLLRLRVVRHENPVPRRRDPHPITWAKC